MFTCFKRNDKREVKVAQLAGSVAEMSSYHHGEVRTCLGVQNTLKERQKALLLIRMPLKQN